MKSLQKRHGMSRAARSRTFYHVIAAFSATALLVVAGTALGHSENDPEVTKAKGEAKVAVSIHETCANAWNVKCSACGPCGETSDSVSTFKTQADAEAYAASRKNCDVAPLINTDGLSLVDNMTFTYHHDVNDYSVGGGAGCVSCGAAGAANQLATVRLARRFRSRNMTEYSSFGPGNFSNYDVKLKLYPLAAGTQADLFDPQEWHGRRFIDGLEGDAKNGTFIDKQNHAYRSLKLLNASGVVTSNLALAKTAEIENWHGSKTRFEVIDLGLLGWTTGQSGGGLEFDGTGAHVSIPDAPNLDNTDKLSISFWIKPSALADFADSDAALPKGIVSKRNNTDNQAAYSCFLYTDNKLHVDLDGSADRFASNATFPVGQWKHVAMTYDGTLPTAERVKLYVNGVLDRTAAETSAAIPDFSSSLLLGFLGGNATGSFYGTLDEVRIYRAALADTDVAGMFATPGSGPATNLEAHYQLDETGGTTVADATANHPGTLISLQRDARLTRMEDTNGYGLTVAYKTWTPAEITASPDRQWQINTVTDAYGRVMTFSYHPAQVAGRWCVSRIDLPNGQHLEYEYAPGVDRLTRVVHPDGTESTFTYGFNVASQRTTIAIDDAAGEGTHRRKTVYLTNNIAEVDGVVYNQSSLLASMVVNGADEVAYLSTSDPNGLYAKIYEGKGRLKRVFTTQRAEFFKDGWLDNGGGYSGFTGSIESTFAEAGYPGSTAPVRQGRYPWVRDVNGVTRNLAYDADSFITTITWPDTTTEGYAYNGFKQVTRYRDRLNRLTRFTYDARGNLTQKEVGILRVGTDDVLQPEYAAYQWEYFPAGHPNQFLRSASIDANGNRTEYVYNAQQFLVEIREPDDTGAGFHTAHSFTYDGAGRLETSTDAVGRTATYFYDSRDRLIKTMYMDGSTEETTYGTGVNANLVVQTKDRNGNTTTFAYDNHGRLTTQVTAANDPSVAVTRTCSYVPGTNLLRNCTDQGETTSYVYDFRHRPISTTVQPRVGKLLTSTTTYDTKNLVSKTTDPYGRKSYNVYRTSDSALIRTVQGTVPADGVTNPATIVRDLGPNAKYVVNDILVDVEGQVTERIDPRNTSHTTAYDTRGRIVESNEAFGKPEVAKTLTFYDANSNVTEIHHPRSFDPADTYGGMFITKMSYGRRNLLKTSTAAFGRTEAATVAYTYNNDGTQNTVLDARSKTWKTLWQLCCQRQFGQADPLATVDDTGTAKHGVRLTRHDHAGNVTYQAVVKATVAELADLALNCCGGGSFDYGANSLNVRTTRYDARHRPVLRTVWLNVPTIVDYADPPIAGENGVPATDGLTTRYTYDDDLDDGNGLDAAFGGLLAGLNLGAGSDGRATLVTNPEGERTLAISDGLGRQVRVMQLDAGGAALNSMTTVHDTVALIGGYGDVVETAVTNALGHTNETRTDAIGRTIETVDAETQKTVSTFDANGNRLTIRDPNSVGMNVEYDFRNRATQQTDTHGDATQATFDKHGNAVELFDAKGQVARTRFDARDRRLLHFDRLHTPSVPSVTQWEYDGNNNLTALIDAETRKTTYAYDERNLKTAETYPDHIVGQNPGDPDYGIVESAYDAARRLVRRTDQLGDTCTFIYDLASRLESRDYRLRVNSPIGPIADQDEFTYDKASRMLTAVSGRYSNTVELTYDDAGRKATEALIIGGETYTVGSAYDVANRPTALTYPDGTVVSRHYTTRDQLQEVQYNGSMVATFAYDLGMRETSRTFGNGLVTSRSYRNDNLTATIDTPGVTSFTYSYDENKNKLSETIGGVMAAYGFSTGPVGYDPDDRLANWSRSDSALNQSWDLSLVGDWSTLTTNGAPETRTHNAAHELAFIGGSPLSHDPKGNLTQRPDGRVFVWDMDNRLKATSLGADSTNFKYDALGRRTSSTTASTTTVLVSAGKREVAEYPGGGAPAVAIRKFAYGSYVDEPLLMDTAGHKRFYHSNSLHSISALTDLAGTVVERYAYRAYGQAIILAPDGATVLAASSQGNPWLFTGRRLDIETGLYCYRERFFDPNLGRFLARDRVGYTDFSRSLYVYVRNRPTIFVDPTGREEEATAFLVQFQGQDYLRGKLFVAKADDAKSFKVQMHLERMYDVRGYRNKWNRWADEVPDEWGRDVYAVDENKELWEWPHLWKLLTGGDGGYGGYDPDKKIHNDYAAILIRKFDDEGVELLKPPLVSAIWKQVGKGKDVSHTAGSEEFQLVPGKCRKGNYKIWLIYADFMGYVSTKGEHPEADGSSLAHFKISFSTDVAETIEEHAVTVEKMPAPPTKYDWGKSPPKSNLVEK